MLKFLLYLFIFLLMHTCNMYYICRMDLYQDKLDFDDYGYLELELRIELHHSVDAKRGILELLLLFYI